MDEDNKKEIIIDDVTENSDAVSAEISAIEEKVIDPLTDLPAHAGKKVVSKVPDPKDNRGLKRNVRKPQNRREPRERVKPEFEQKIISIRRVTRVVTGGRRFNFSVAVVAGDRAGRVGVGQGKASDTPIAIDKAMRDAKKNMIRVTSTKNHSIPHEVSAKYSGSQVIIMPAPGKGVLAGSSVRTVLEFAGIKEVGAKLLSRSKNKVNNAKAAIKALGQLKNIKI